MEAKRVSMAAASAPYMASWVMSSISLLLYNKHLYRAGKGGGGFPFPLTLVTVHQLALGMLLWAVRVAAPASLRSQLMPGRGSSLGDRARAIVPIALLQAVALAAQNQALQLSSAHFVIMLNATKPVLVSLLQSAFGLAELKCLHLQIVSAISAGVMLAVAGEVQFVLAGLVALLVAQVTEGIRIVLIQKSLSGEDELDAATLLSYSAPVCALVLAPVAAVAEVRTMEASTIRQLNLLPLVVSTVLAALVNISGVMVIQKTDALILVLAGIVKDFIGIFVSVWFFAATLMPSQVVGYSIAVLFINVYRESRRNEALFLSAGLCYAMLSLARPAEGRLQLACDGTPRGDGHPADGGPHGGWMTRQRRVLALLTCVCIAGLLAFQAKLHSVRTDGAGASLGPKPG
mmetsp:Transcript_68806/g.194190  ORF Transcript_68806/g.194190 Transcript_68806/m.194190 type:complete len:403 (-) Transcript_68806:143-1351(-)